VERKAELLIADFDENTGLLCKRIAQNLGCQTKLATDLQSVFSAIRHEDIGVVLLDTITIIDYLDVTASFKKESAKVQVLVVDERATIPNAVAAIKAGAVEYLEKPLDKTILEGAISQALSRSRNFQTSVVPLNELEKRAIENALAQSNGDKIQAARLLSIGKTTLYRKLREYHGRAGSPLRRNGTE
jgi:DNA-binding NtrC family response regulator